MYDFFQHYTSQETTNHTITDCHYEINYQSVNGNLNPSSEITIAHKVYPKKNIRIKLLSNCISHLSIDGYEYSFAHDMTLTSLRRGNEVLFHHRIGSNINGEITCDGVTIQYKDGYAISTDYQGNLYRKVNTNLNFYLIYPNSGGGIYGYLQGIKINLVAGKGGYALIGGGRILGHMSILDPNVQVQWNVNISQILRQVNGYNADSNAKRNLLPWHYFNDEPWHLLLEHKIIMPYNRDIQQRENESNFVLHPDLFIRYDRDHSIVEWYGYQPNLEVIGGNFHGMLSLGNDYFFHHGICQWMKEGNIYWVRYTDNYTIKMQIFADRVVVKEQSNRQFPFKDGLATVSYSDATGEIVQIRVTYNAGIPFMTTYGRIRNFIL